MGHSVSKSSKSFSSSYHNHKTKNSDVADLPFNDIKNKNKNYLSIKSRTASPAYSHGNKIMSVSVNSPLSLTPQHHETLMNLRQTIILSPAVNKEITNSTGIKKIKSRNESDYNYNINTDNLEGTASLFSSISNLTNSIIGAGILGLPFAMSRAGIITALFLILFFGFLTFLGLYFLMYCSKYFPISRHSSFYNLSLVFLPKPFRKIMDVSVAFNCFGFMVSYIMISADMFQSLAKQFILNPNSILLNRELLITIFFVVFILPIVQFKHLDNFKFLSLIAILCFVWITIIIVIYAFIPQIFGESITRSRDDDLQLFPVEIISFVSILPIYTFGFLCHQNAFSITNELSNNSMNRLNIINTTTILIVSIIYMSVSFCSYYTFGNSILSDALNNYPTNLIIFTITRLSLIIAILFSFPTAAHPARDSISSILFNLKSIQLSKLQYNLLTYIMVICAYILAMLIDNLAMVFSFIGATAGTIISYIYPGLIYVFMFKDNPTHALSVHIACLLIGFGCILMPFAILCIFLSNT